MYTMRTKKLGLLDVFVPSYEYIVFKVSDPDLR